MPSLDEASDDGYWQTDDDYLFVVPTFVCWHCKEVLQTKPINVALFAGRSQYAIGEGYCGCGDKIWRVKFPKAKAEYWKETTDAIPS
jgi:hypothetical protein